MWYDSRTIMAAPQKPAEVPNVTLVVMAGGSGTRFWPRSTSRVPKQFLSFAQGAPTLLQSTLQRFEGMIPSHRQFIVTTRVLGPVARQQAPDAQILEEPMGRNTAPCIYWAARLIAERNPQEVMLVMPSDHSIASVPRFHEAILSAIECARSSDSLVTLGVKPTRPETGYGYLRLAQPVNETVAPVKVEAFVEKPTTERAAEFLTSGKYLWNGGMFAWKAQVILEAFDRHLPQMKEIWEKARCLPTAPGFIDEVYPQWPSISVDYGILEKSSSVQTVPLDCGWDDLGSWTALEGAPNSNTVVAGQCVAVDAAGNVIDAPGHCVALLGVKDLIVVRAGEAIMVAQKSKAQEVRKLVDEVGKLRPDLI